MARLIDADYITEGRVSNDPVVIAAKCAPTIDAIPVEWLKKVRKGDNLTLEDVETIDWLISWWQKEQEAR